MVKLYFVHLHVSLITHAALTDTKEKNRFSDSDEVEWGIVTINGGKKKCWILIVFTTVVRSIVGMCVEYAT